MSSSDAQPPLSRRQARERERAAAAGSQPVTPPPTVAAPDRTEEPRRRPGSHVAPSLNGPAQRPVPSAPDSSVPSAPNSSVPSAPIAPAPVGSAPSPSVPVTSVPVTSAPASATEIVPGTGGMTRRQLRLLREAEGQAVQPVPLRAPTPQSSDRTVQDVIGSVDTLDRGADGGRPPGSAPQPAVVPSDGRRDEESATDQVAEPESDVLDDAAIAQATEADGSPDALEPLGEAAAHAEEPRRHRSTWAAHDDETPAEDGSVDAAPTAAPLPGVPAVPSVPSSATPGVFPLSLDDDTNEVPVQQPTVTSDPDDELDAPAVPDAFRRPVEPKPVTTAFAPPTGHWSQLAHDSNDAEVHDEETGTRRVAVHNTNSIVLPDSALADPTGALNATGEVILTGSIDLPASLSSTGSHRPIDGAEVDRLLEQHDEQPETDASPVRASRAISSHTSTRQVVLAAAKPKESRTPVILGVTVGAVGVAAAAVIIVALVTTHMGG